MVNVWPAFWFLSAIFHPPISVGSLLEFRTTTHSSAWLMSNSLTLNERAASKPG
jgi:hypothetical protein